MAGLALSCLALTACVPRVELSRNAPATARALQELTGARTRVAWVQDVERKGDLFGRVSLKALVGFDSGDGRGDRPLLAEPQFIVKPLITPRGDRVVFSDFKALEARIVNWDGTGLRTLGPGQAIEVWIDPGSGKEWVYLQRGPHAGEEFHRNPVYRHEIDRPEVAELVWNKTPVSAIAAGSFQVSTDGRRAVGLLPWPDAGILDLEANTWSRFANGCWTALSPDATLRPWIFDGAHRNLFMVSAEGHTTAKIDLTRPAAGGRRGEVYHPRWSNHPRFLAVTGPYFLGHGVPLAGGPQVEVLVGRFNESYTRVEQWVQVTTNGRGDYFPDVWVDRDPLDEKPATVAPGAVAAARDEVRWPGDIAGLVFRWENASRKNEVVDPRSGEERLCRVEARGLARIGRQYVMDLRGGGGAFTAERLDFDLLEALQSGYGFTVEATLTPAAPTAEAAPVISYAADPARGNFALVQEGDRLVFFVRANHLGTVAEGRLDLGPVEPGRTVHVAVAYAPWGALSGYIDGREVAATDAVAGDLSAWTPQPLTFGGRLPGGPWWSGQIDGVAIYSDPLDGYRVAAHADLNRARVGSRTPASRVVVEATLRELTPTPSPAAIAPYRRCLVVHRYRIDSVLSGDLPQGEILVAHWGILDGRRVAGMQRREGSAYRLEVEPFDENPQLTSERMDMSTTAFDLPLYYDPTPGRARTRGANAGAGADGGADGDGDGEGEGGTSVRAD